MEFFCPVAPGGAPFKNTHATVSYREHIYVLTRIWQAAAWIRISKNLRKKLGQAGTGLKPCPKSATGCNLRMTGRRSLYFIYQGLLSIVSALFSL